MSGDQVKDKRRLSLHSTGIHISGTWRVSNEVKSSPRPIPELCKDTCSIRVVGVDTLHEETNGRCKLTSGSVRGVAKEQPSIPSLNLQNLLTPGASPRRSSQLSTPSKNLQNLLTPGASPRRSSSHRGVHALQALQSFSREASKVSVFSRSSSTPVIGNNLSRPHSTSSTDTNVSYKPPRYGHCEALVCSDVGQNAAQLANIFAAEARDYGYVDLAQGPELSEINEEEEVGCVELFFPPLQSRRSERASVLLSKESSDQQDDVVNAYVRVGLFVLKRYETESGAILLIVEGRGAARCHQKLAHEDSDGIVSQLTSSGQLTKLTPVGLEAILRENANQMSQDRITRQTTLALVTPESIQHLHFIRRLAVDHGFKVLQHRLIQLTPREAQMLKSKYVSVAPPARRNQPNYQLQSSAPQSLVCILALQRVEAVVCWQQLLGPLDAESAREQFPRSLRGQLFLKPPGLRPTSPGAGVYGSTTVESATSVLQAFCPDLALEDIMPQASFDDCATTAPLLLDAKSTFEVDPQEDVAQFGTLNSVRGNALLQLRSVIHGPAVYD